MINVNHLYKSFRDVAAVRDVSFSAGNGAITGLLGHNGAGKSTTLRILYGLLKPDSGSALVDGEGVVERPLDVQERIGVMTDAHGLYPRLTAREHIEYFARLRGMDRKRSATRCEELLERLDMGGIADRRAQGFSHGERMKVSLARSLVHDPGTIIMDEPTNGLDVMTIRSVRRMLQELKADGKCILLSSHVMQEIGALCDRVVVLARGQVLMEGSLDDLLTRSGEDDLENAFMKITGQ